ncbi:MAG: hypothetical protein GXP01_08890 [Alphaproteobacteria bacterium]|nr:hypothetical protein [Alphaproteobacteria bacterium]
MDAPNVIEVALLFIVVFLAGCLVGYLLRRITAPTVVAVDESGDAADTRSGTSRVDKDRPDAVSKSETAPGPVASAGVIPASSDSLPTPSPKVASAISGAAAGAASAAGGETIATMAADPAIADPDPDPDPQPEPKAAVSEVPAPASQKNKKPAQLAKGEKTAKGKKAAKSTESAKAASDDLKKIKGIGPKIEKLLLELGISRYDEIAQWDRARIDEVDGQLKFKGRIDREEWVAQAGALAAAAKSRESSS